MRISVIIPALNEEEPIAAVVRSCLTTGLPDEVIVVDNGSTDRTAERAQAAGAKVVAEPDPGYGRACAAGVQALSPHCEIVVFLDGDGSDCPEFMDRLVEPVIRGEQDFVIGSRTRGNREAGSMNFQQVFAGRIAGFLLRLLYGVRYSDMCPFRAIRRDALERLGMRETTYGPPGRGCGFWNCQWIIAAALVANRKCRERSEELSWPGPASSPLSFASRWSAQAKGSEPGPALRPLDPGSAKKCLEQPRAGGLQIVFPGAILFDKLPP